MSEISLTASMRSNLLSLQNTQSLMDTTQERLSTGKKVNSAIDNPSSYYTAQSLNNRASDLSSLLDSMGQGIQTIKAADEAIEAITTFAQQAKAIANSARDEAPKAAEGKGTVDKDTAGKITLKYKDDKGVEKTLDIAGAEANTDLAKVTEAINTAIAGNADFKDKFKATETSSGIKLESVDGTVASVEGTINGVAFGEGSEIGSEARLNYEKQFNAIMDQIDQLAKDASYKGINLLQKNDLTVVFNEDRSSKIDIKGVDASSEGLGMHAASGWGNADNKAIDTTISEVEAAVSKLRTMASEFGNNYSVVQNREDFTENLINVLTEGADKLTLADMNEESANMLALQTRQQLAINSLSLASQAAQSVLKLF